MKFEVVSNSDNFQIKIIDEDITVKTYEGTFEQLSSVDFLANAAKELVSMGFDEKETKKVLEEAVKNMFEKKQGIEENTIKRNTIKFFFIKPLYSHPVKNFSADGSLSKFDIKFKLFKAYKDVASPPLILYDPNGSIKTKKLEYSIVKVTPEDIEELQNAPAKVWEEVAKQCGINVDKNDSPLLRLYEQDIILKTAPRLKQVDFLKEWGNEKWRKYVESIVNYGDKEIDERLVLIRKAHLLSGIMQPINPHALIILPGQTGKSEWYKYVGVCEDKVTANSLIGYADTEGPKLGSVADVDLPFALDQVESSSAYSLFRYLLGLMESGNATVDVSGYQFEVRSNAIFAILSNPLGKGEADVGLLLDKLAQNATMGRRFGIILYDKQAKIIKTREKELEKVRELVQLLRAIEEYCRPELIKIIKSEKVWDWLNEKNEEYMQQARKVLDESNVENEKLRMFLLEFISNSGSHTRGGALRIALLMNLDKIALKEYDVDEILSEAEEYVSEILEINFSSIARILAGYKETRLETTARLFDIMPQYLREIVSAVELWKRSLSDEEKQKISVPYTIALKSLDYTPSNGVHFSKVLELARRSNPERFNEKLHEYFNMEIKRLDKNELQATIFSLEPLEKISPLGKLGKQGELA
jgi:predicted transcriptional regulator